MFGDIKNYLNDNMFRINIYENKINIVNYIDIIALEDNRISIKYEKGLFIIKGKNLTLNKLLDSEILITGKISGLEFE